jgi:hypothetical protein
MKEEGKGRGGEWKEGREGKGREQKGRGGREARIEITKVWRDDFSGLVARSPANQISWLLMEMECFDPKISDPKLKGHL